jgi:hypothetical protein
VVGVVGGGLGGMAVGVVGVVGGGLGGMVVGVVVGGSCALMSLEVLWHFKRLL